MTQQEDIFNYIYANNLWGAESLSGTASDLYHTQNLRKFLPEFIEKYHIKSMIDAPCGDMFWLSQLNLNKIKYHGYDIVDGLIEKNKENFKRKRNYTFEKKDVITDPLPKVDLIMCRDLIIHFPLDAIYALIFNFIRSRSKYLLITQHVLLACPEKMNLDITFGDFSYRNLTLPPFNFPLPKLLIPEEWNDTNCLRYMALYELDTLKAFLSH